LLSLFTALALSAAPGGPTKANVGIYVVDVRSVDLRAQSFFADFYLWIRYPETDEETAKKIEKLEPVNGKFESREETDRKTIDGQSYVCWRVGGTFFFHANLAQYPFDRQSLPIELESETLDDGELMLVDDGVGGSADAADREGHGAQAQIRVPEYKLKKVERAAKGVHYPTTFGDPERKSGVSAYSRYELKMTFERESFGYFLKIVLPLLIIIAMAWLVYFLPADQIDTAASVAMTALLSTMAYNVAVSQQMPEVGYLVLSDKFFISTYALLFVSLAQTFWTFVLHSKGQAEKAFKIDYHMRWIFPLAVAVIFILLWVGAKYGGQAA
jgi:hypothetical protein